MQKASILLLFPFFLAACEQLGIEDPAKAAAAREAEGRAIGGACRHSGRALEDCYVLNPKAPKAAIYAGWRDMDAYMRENNIEIVPAVLPKPDPDAKKKKKKSAEEGEAGEKTGEPASAPPGQAQPAEQGKTAPTAIPTGSGKIT
ncbi:MAG: hypothetical protein N2690_01925 [Rhodocyclaceae bacterium]|nr:hypothetical protein [Rhodocyclaceae bacterium]